jgi:hypothetical protein
MFNLFFYFGFTYLFLTIFIGFERWFGLYYVVACGCILFIYRWLPVSLTNQWLVFLSVIADKSTTSFVLSDTGECQLNERESLQISAHSQTYLWGYWLIFNENGSAIDKIFIFKDSLCKIDQARLARAIFRVKSFR